MKITNFRLTERKGSNCLDWKFKALVNIETGFIFTKSGDVEIYKEYGSFWSFCDTGKFTPSDDVEELVRKEEAMRMKEIEHWEI